MITSIRLPDDLEKKLTAFSKITGKKKSSFILEALREYLEELEDYYVVTERMRDYDPTESVSLEELKNTYGVED